MIKIKIKVTYHINYLKSSWLIQMVVVSVLNKVI